MEGILLPYQNRWNQDRTPVKFMEKSRRIGISYADACESAILAGTEGRSGTNTFYISYNKEMTETFIADVGAWAKRLNAAASEVEEVLLEDEKDILAFRVRFATGNHVTALSSKPKNLRSKQGRIVIDEAAFCEDLGELLKAAIALTMWGGQVEVISTHNGEDNEFNEYVQDIRAGKKPYSLHRVTLDDALAEGLYRRICAVRGLRWSLEAERKWRTDLIEFYGFGSEEELFCIPSRGSGIFIARALIEGCMNEDIPVLRWACKPEFAELPEPVRYLAAEIWCEENIRPHLEAMPQDHPSFLGEDFGRSGDLTVMVPLQEQPGLKYQAPFVLELRNVPFRQQEQVLFYICDRLPRFSGAALDARGNGQYLAEVAMQRYGSWKAQQVMLSETWYREQMPRYKAAFEDRSILLPKDADILDDHRAIRMERGVAKVPEGYRGKGRDGGQRHGDSAIAGALAWFSTKTDGGPVEYESVGTRRVGEHRGAY
ncbi:MAG: hypothetical protein ABFD98_15675 [Syntrophobacteraceae bacterium]|nr:hypothetical protein [Desulfobacteraceae bacterium]